jgi:hypothetical protein
MEPTPTFPLGAPPSLHLVGYLAGTVIYALLLLTLWQSRTSGLRRGGFAIGVLGLVWNVCNLLASAVAATAVGWARPFIDAAAYTALGALPAVAAHSALRAPDTNLGRRLTVPVTVAAYVVAVGLGVAHLRQALLFDYAPSPPGMRVGTAAFAAITLAVLVVTHGQAGWRRALWVISLGLSSLSGLHLTRWLKPESWALELLGHHASPLLALAILYQDYPFALADRFLKRALALLGMTMVVIGAYAVLPIVLSAAAMGNAPPAIGLGLGVLAACCYPVLQRGSEWLVDHFVLRRDTHGRVRGEITAAAQAATQAETLLAVVAGRLGRALGAADATWTRLDDTAEGPGQSADGDSGAIVSVTDGRAGARIALPTSDAPRFAIHLSDFGGGRRLTADDVALLESVAVTLARRIDALRRGEERVAHAVREQESRTLAAEAELTALRAQLNPHFLFNALNTVGHLIQTAPDRALDTLLDLTDLLRRVLKSEGRYTTLGREMEVIEAYLQIERARFEERLGVDLDVDAGLGGVEIPPLAILPLVENAIKHGIARSLRPGRIGVAARLTAASDPVATGPVLTITVSDTGADTAADEVGEHFRTGVGLANLERRLRAYYGDRASLTFRRRSTGGTTVEVRVPVALGPDLDAAPGMLTGAGPRVEP